MQSSLARHVRSDPDPNEGRRHAHSAWHTHGIIMLRTDWLSNDFDRQIATTLAETAHGKRGE